jgi:small-conductance mechanosensitive channel/CRP-like cAMP-binding protein
MDIGSGILDEFRQDKTVELLAAAVVLLAVTRALAGKHAERLRSAVVLFGLHLALLPVAGALRMGGSTLYRETRLASLALATLAFIGTTATLLFHGVLPRLRVSVPRILQDVLVASSSGIAIFMVASRAGVNLSGLIATSAVLTAVIGLAFQDTLGNVVGGLAIQLDDSVRLGDWIKVGEVVGRVTEIRWRYTAVETRNWETVILPNSLLVKGQVTVLGRRAGQPPYWRRWVYFNVDFRYPPSDVVTAVLATLAGGGIDNVAESPPPNCVLMDLHESYGRYAVRYWLTDLAVDDPTDSVVRTRIYFALRRANIPLSMPAHAVFLTEDSTERKEGKTQAETGRRLRAIDQVELFRGLSEEEHAHLADHLHHAPFAAGEVMTRQGAEAHWLYIVIGGTASVRVTAEGGVEREVARLEAGAFFGEMSLLTGQSRAATVVALTPVECYRLDKAAFQGLIGNRPEIAEQIADVLARRRMELSAVRENLDEEAERERLRVTRTDLVGKIRGFFALEEPPRRRS